MSPEDSDTTATAAEAVDRAGGFDPAWPAEITDAAHEEAIRLAAERLAAEAAAREAARAGAEVAPDESALAAVPGRGMSFAPFLAGMVPTAPPRTTHVEIVGVGLRVRGYMRQTHGGRFSDQVNLALRSLHLYEASLVDREGHTHSILSEDLYITRRQIVLISELRTGELHPDPDLYIQKGVRPVVAVAPAFVITGNLHLVPGAAADIYFESDDPPFIPLTNAEVRWRLDESRMRYDFALLNREQISAIGLRPMGAVDPEDD